MDDEQEYIDEKASRSTPSEIGDISDVGEAEAELDYPDEEESEVEDTEEEKLKLDLYRKVIADEKGIALSTLIGMTRAELDKIQAADQLDIEDAVDLARERLKQKTDEESIIIDLTGFKTKRPKRFVPVTDDKEKAKVVRAFHKAKIPPKEAGFSEKTENITTQKQRIKAYTTDGIVNVAWKEFLTDAEIAGMFSRYLGSVKRGVIVDRVFVTSSDFNKFTKYLTDEQISILTRIFETKLAKVQEEINAKAQDKLSAVKYYSSQYKNIPLASIFKRLSDEILFQIIPGYEIGYTDLETAEFADENTLWNVIRYYPILANGITSIAQLRDLVDETAFVLKYEREERIYISELRDKKAKSLPLGEFKPQVLLRVWKYTKDLHKERIYEYFRNLARRKDTIFEPHVLILRKIENDIATLRSFLQNPKIPDIFIEDSNAIRKYMIPYIVAHRDAYKIEFIPYKSHQLIDLARGLYSQGAEVGTWREQVHREHNYYSESLDNILDEDSIVNLLTPDPPANKVETEDQRKVIQHRYDKQIRELGVPVDFVPGIRRGKKSTSIIQDMRIIINLDSIETKYNEDTDAVVLPSREFGTRAVIRFLDKAYERFERFREIQKRSFLKAKEVPRLWTLQPVTREEYIESRFQYGWKFQTIKSFFSFYLYQKFPPYHPLLGKIKSTRELDTFILSYNRPNTEWVLYETLANLEEYFAHTSLGKRSYRDISLSIISLFRPFVVTSDGNIIHLSVELSEDDLEANLVEFVSNAKGEMSLIDSITELLTILTGTGINGFMIPETVLERLVFKAVVAVEKNLPVEVKLPESKLAKRITDRDFFWGRSSKKLREQTKPQISSKFCEKLLRDMLLKSKVVVQVSENEIDYEQAYDILADKIVNIKQKYISFEQWYEIREKTRQDRCERLEESLIRTTIRPVLYRKGILEKLALEARDTAGPMFRLPKPKLKTPPAAKQTLKGRYIEIDVDQFLRGVKRKREEEAPGLKRTKAEYKRKILPIIFPEPIPEEPEEPDPNHPYYKLRKEYEIDMRAFNAETYFNSILNLLKQSYISEIVYLNRPEVDELIERIKNNKSHVALLYLIHNDRLPFIWFKYYMMNPENTSKLHLFDTVEKVSPEIWVTNTARESYESIRKYIDKYQNSLGIDLIPPWQGNYKLLTSVSQIPLYQNIAIRQVGNNLVFLNKSKEFWAKELLRYSFTGSQPTMNRHSDFIRISTASEYHIKSTGEVNLEMVPVTEEGKITFSSPCVYFSRDKNRLFFTLQDTTLLGEPPVNPERDLVSYHQYENFVYRLKTNSSIPGMIANGYIIFLKENKGKVYRYISDSDPLEELRIIKPIKDYYTDGVYLYLRVAETKSDNEYILFDKQGNMSRINLGYYSAFVGRLYYHADHYHYFESMSSEPGDYQYKGYFDPDYNFIRFNYKDFENITFLTMSNGIINGKGNISDDVHVFRDVKSQVLFVYSRNVTYSWISRDLLSPEYTLNILVNDHV